MPVTRVIDQRLLPFEVRWVDLTTADECAEAIRQMMLRGVGGIGGLAAIGTALAWHHWPTSAPRPSAR